MQLLSKYSLIIYVESNDQMSAKCGDKLDRVAAITELMFTV